jgi:hypothetical protein
MLYHINRAKQIKMKPNPNNETNQIKNPAQTKPKKTTLLKRRTKQNKRNQPRVKPFS